MTVKLLGPWGLQPAGTLYTTDATTEAAMVAAKVATSDLTGGVVYVPPGGATVPPSSGSGGGIALGGGSDMTAATVGAYGVETYTAAAQWVVTRNGVGVPLTEYLLGDVSLASTLSDAGGGIYIVSAGLTHVSGALVMTLAQRTTWTALAPIIAKGFKVFVSDVGLLVNAAGTSFVPGCECAWSGSTALGWLWTRPLVYVSYQAGTLVNNASGALALSRALTIPFPAINSHSRVFTNVFWDLVAGTSVAKTLHTQVNSTALFNSGGSALFNMLQYTAMKSLYGMGSASQIHTPATTNGDAVGAVNAGFATRSINFATTDCLVEARATASEGSATCKMLSVSVIDEIQLV
jgi:hypothetical protein